jgi:minor extracellular serine protease Vpr
MHIKYLRIVCAAFLLVGTQVILHAHDDAWEKLDPILRKDLNRKGAGTLLFDRAPGNFESLAVPQADIKYNVVIVGDDEYLNGLPVRVNSRHRGFVTALVTPEELREISSMNGIEYIEKGGFYQLHLDRSIVDIRARDVHSGTDIASPLKGRNVILGFIDTGIDFFHHDFRDPADPTQSRIISIWDMGLTPEGDENHPVQFNYGVEYTRASLEADLRLGEKTNVRTVDIVGHGTHIAGIAAGNGRQGFGRYTGVAPEAELIVVRVDIFSTARIIDGMNYIFSMAQELGRPAVVNLSVGTHGGSHDGTLTIEQAVDQHAEWGGRAITISAGNNGNERIHTGGTVETNQTVTFRMNVPQYPVQNQNEIIHFLWYEGAANAELRIRTPGGRIVHAKTGQDFFEQTSEGTIEIIAPITTNPKGARLFAIFIDDFNNGVPPSPGRWEFMFTPLTGRRVVQYNNWLVFSSMGDIDMTPSTGRDYTVSMPGTAEGGITVGAHTTKTTWTDSLGQGWQIAGTAGAIAPFSGGGPTRDGRLKPEITAPGFVVASAHSRDAQVPTFFMDAVRGYSINAGTSMAAPHVMGIIAMMFEQNPNLRTDQILDILVHAGREDFQTRPIPNTTWGYGKVNAKFLANAVFRYSHAPEDFKLFQNYPNPFNPTTRIEFTVPSTTPVKLIVYDLLGREVNRLVDDTLEPRHYIINFDASNLSSGFYYYRLISETFIETRSMLYLK